jgi:hypothetical protein
VEWHINDLSLSGQFVSPQAFRAVVEPLIQLRLRRPELRRRIYCSRALYTRLATATQNLQHAILATRDRDYIRLALEWLANSGPFWDNERAPNADDLFYYRDADVTDQGLGEAARRKIISIQSNAFSFLDDTRHFAQSPLGVTHGLLDEPLDHLEIDNFWTVDALEATAELEPQTWNETMEVAQRKMDRLIFARNILDQLQPTPFYRGISDRVLELLGVLQTIVLETNDDSSLTDRGMEVYQRHFVGERAWFSDESDANKRRFGNELTFEDPSAQRRDLFCPWHGKVRVGQFRIHFEWPRPVGQKGIKVVYIGPKITKA